MIRIELTFAMLLLVTSTIGSAAISGEPAEDTLPKREDKLSVSMTDQDVCITLECPKTFYSGAENYITIVVQNRSDRPLLFSFFNFNYQGPHFSLVRDGKRVRRAEFGDACFVGNNGVEGVVQVPRGQEVRTVVNVSRFYDLSVPGGGYQIFAYWNGYIDAKMEDRLALRTPTLDLSVREKKGESVSVHKIE